MKRFTKYTVEISVADEHDLTNAHPNLMSYNEEQRVLEALAREFYLDPSVINGEIKVETIKAEKVKED